MSAKRPTRKSTSNLSPAQLESPDTLPPEELAARRARMDAEMAERNRRQGHDLLAEGARLLGQRRPGEAAAKLEKSAALLPDNVDVAINLAGAYVLQRRYSLAVSTLERAKTQEPTNPMVWVNLAAAYLGSLDLSGPQQQDQAIAAYEQALALDPKSPNVHYNLGLIYKDRKDWPRAEGWFRLALETDPTDSDAQYWLDYIADLELES